MDPSTLDYVIAIWTTRFFRVWAYIVFFGSILTGLLYQLEPIARKFFPRRTHKRGWAIYDGFIWTLSRIISLNFKQPSRPGDLILRRGAFESGERKLQHYKQESKHGQENSPSDCGGISTINRDDHQSD